MGQNNVMRWDCSRSGCFNTKCRPKLGVFADCFPGKIGFGDVDAIVEINSMALMLEWKFKRCELDSGQRIMFERLTADRRVTVFVVAGGVETMAVDGVRVYFAGKARPRVDCDLSDLKEKIKKWVAFAKRGL